MILHNVEYQLIPKVYNWRMSAWWFLRERCAHETLQFLEEGTAS